MEMRYIIGWVVTGLLVGMAARFFYPGPVPMGWLGSIALGIGGSFVGGWLGRMLSGRRDSTGLEPAGCLGSIIGAMLLILAARMLHLL